MKTPYLTLTESEKIKKQKTMNAIPGFYNFIPYVYNTFIKLPFHMGIKKDEEDVNIINIQDTFQFYIYDFPFKVRNIYTLMEIGSYTDATILFRTLVESFIYYKYYILNNDGVGLSKYILRETKPRIKDIFERVVPGFYDGIYSELCNHTHGNPLIQAIFRGNTSKETPLKSDINNINLDWFSYVSNQLEPLFIGVIRLYKIAFPNNTIEKDKDLMKGIEVIHQFVEKNILDRKTLYPVQLPMIEYYNKIIEVNYQNN